MSAPDKVRIVALAGPLEGEQWEFAQDQITIGRSTSNDVAFKGDTTVSRSHATISWRDGEWEIRDDNSANGTHVLEGSLRKKLDEPFVFKGKRRFYFGASEIDFLVGADSDPVPAATVPNAPAAVHDRQFRYALPLSISKSGDELVYRFTSPDARVSEFSISFDFKEIDNLKQQLRDAVARAYLLRLSGEDAGPEEIHPELQQLGDWLRTQCIPKHVNDLLDDSEETFLTLTLDPELLGIPWELASLDEGILGLRYAVGRQIVFRDPGSIRQPATRVAAAPARILIVANPSGDVREAQRHGEELLNLTRRRLPNATVDFLAGERAGKVEILTRMRATDVVYYVGHAEHDIENPSNSAWVVANGHIRAESFERLDPAPRLVLSNSCESARETFAVDQLKDNNSAGGIARAFIAAGTINYMGALWPIAARQSAYFGQAMVEELLEGRAVGDALRGARRRSIDHFGIGDPVWASYVLYGDPTLSPV